MKSIENCVEIGFIRKVFAPARPQYHQLISLRIPRKRPLQPIYLVRMFLHNFYPLRRRTEKAALPRLPLHFCDGNFRYAPENQFSKESQSGMGIKRMNSRLLELNFYRFTPLRRFPQNASMVSAPGNRLPFRLWLCLPAPPGFRKYSGSRVLG